MELRPAAQEVAEGGAWQSPGSWTSGFPSPTYPGPRAHAPGGRAGKASPCGMRSPPGVVVLALRQFVYLVAIGPHFPEAPGPNWGVSEG